MDLELPLLRMLLDDLENIAHYESNIMIVAILHTVVPHKTGALFNNESALR